MDQTLTSRIFARCAPDNFVGRESHLDKLLALARGESDPRGIVLLAAPFAGASELLRQTYDRLFHEQEEVIPFYFELKASDRTTQAAAMRFLCEFLVQTVAFRRREPGIISASPAISEVAELATPSDGYWIDRLVMGYRGESETSGERSFVRNCLGAPIRAAANGARVFVMIDGLHATVDIDGGEAFLDDITELFSRSAVPFAFAGLRRFAFARLPFETMSLQSFSFSEAGEFIERMAGETGTLVNDQTRDLIAVQFGGNAGLISLLLAAAATGRRDMLSFEQVEQVYTDEIFGGRICRRFNAIFDRIVSDASTQKNILRLLSEFTDSAETKSSVEHWKEKSALSPDGLEAVLEGLNHYEFITLSSGKIESDAYDLVFRDYIGARKRLELDQATRALAVGEALTANVKRAPSLMARHYRRSTAIGLRALMQSFDAQQISPMLIDYKSYKTELKGLSASEVMDRLKRDPETISLPRIVYTAHSADLYPPLREICDAERSAVALGFTGHGEDDEIVWIAAEVDSKLEANADAAEFWCDRLEVIALNCNFPSYKLWLVAPEGFEPAAMQVFDERNAYGSSRRQAELMKSILNSSDTVDERAAIEYEFVVPMGDDTEMIAAHAVEEIAKRHKFPTKAINQVKTALIEACINAAEHSLSPDRKIYQKFVIDDEKLTVTIANRGVRLNDKHINEVNTDSTRRGWGLKLMKGLMDDVKIEQTDDGTRITMVKYIQKAVATDHAAK
jgi:serine/threonine-protein kinase RsbW